MASDRETCLSTRRKDPVCSQCGEVESSFSQLKEIEMVYHLLYATCFPSVFSCISMEKETNKMLVSSKS